jgi:DNA modification methylase
MLTWVGKRPLRRVTVFPAQLVETFNPTGQAGGWRNLLFHGDNKDVLASLLANGFRGKVNLVYIDPPFDSGADYVRKVQLRGVAGITKVDGETYTLGEQIQYTDIWANDNYLQFMYERLLLLKEVLADDGGMFLHCDSRKMHHLRCLMDEVFGPEAFVNEIIWQHQIMGGAHDKRFPKAHETVFWYARGNEYRLRSEEPDVRVPFSDYVRKSMQRDDDGRWYYERRRMSRKATEEEAARKAHTRTYVDDPEGGTVATDVWSDMLSYQEPPDEREGLDLYPTQKTTKLLTRIISAASAHGDLVLDCFAGSGVVAKVAQRLGRRWIACDINKGAIQTTAKRLQGIIREQIEAGRQGELVEREGGGPAKPAALSFSVYRVNDYDLAIQHNEAVNLACEHLGVQRTRTDGYFDGTLGKRLVKIVPFGHPLTPLDLQELERELKSRPEEDRHVVMVCLGKEPGADTWLEEWNRHRPVNKIEVIELRTDKKYGKFFTHQPSRARVEVRRVKGKILVEVKDFISPTILERLNMDQNLFRAQVTDWRAMVDSVMIDTAHNGHVFNVALSDVPERKADLVSGRYELPAPPGPTTVTVKITDMLGEEVLVTSQLR